MLMLLTRRRGDESCCGLTPDADETRQTAVLVSFLDSSTHTAVMSEPGTYRRFLLVLALISVRSVDPTVGELVSVRVLLLVVFGLAATGDRGTAAGTVKETRVSRATSLSQPMTRVQGSRTWSRRSCVFWILDRP